MTRRRPCPAAPGPLEGYAARLDDASPDPRPFIAYELHRDAGFKLVPASATRAWMAATPKRFANRCLPLLIANQAGWLVLNGAPVHLLWSGTDALKGVAIEYEHQPPAYCATSHFGHGIVTWNLPFLFRTPPGYNLLVRGPANWFKDGAYPLEGIVETDWVPATFTMNWKLTRPGVSVRFDMDEPLCMLVPQRRGELEEFEPEIRNIATDAETRSSYEAWLRNRAQFLQELKHPDSQAVREGWQKHYFQGKMPDASTAPSHQTRLRLRPFLRRS